MVSNMMWSSSLEAFILKSSDQKYYLCPTETQTRLGGEGAEQADYIVQF